MTAVARVFEFNARVYRRTWRGGIISTVVAPILFLASLGFGLGRFVDSAGTGSPAAPGLTYAAFLAPGLLAAQAMQAAGFASTYPIMGKVVWDRIYHGMLATPITIPGIVLGELAWVAARLTMVSAVFLAVMAVFGLVPSPLGILALPAAVLTGLAFAAPIMAFTATRRDTQAFDAIFRFGITPLFLFSGTFFPIDRLPAFLQAVAMLTPLWHGVALCRSLTLGVADPVGAAVHIVYLTAWVIAGTLAALVSFRRTLVR
jgi:lipooligosaccharide transport system permease protein